MSDTKFTPGPWEVSAGSLYRVMSSSRMVSGQIQYGQYICDTANNPKTRTPENAANARLISAAPDLYEALQTVFAEMGEKHYPADAEDGWWKTYEKVEAALAKAVSNA